MKLKWFSVWGVRDYYTPLEQRAQAGAEVRIWLHCMGFNVFLSDMEDDQFDQIKRNLK